MDRGDRDDREHEHGDDDLEQAQTGIALVPQAAKQFSHDSPPQDVVVGGSMRTGKAGRRWCDAPPVGATTEWPELGLRGTPVLLLYVQVFPVYSRWVTVKV